MNWASSIIKDLSSYKTKLLFWKKHPLSHRLYSFLEEITLAGSIQKNKLLKNETKVGVSKEKYLHKFQWLPNSLILCNKSEVESFIHHSHTVYSRIPVNVSYLSWARTRKSDHLYRSGYTQTNFQQRRLLTPRQKKDRADNLLSHGWKDSFLSHLMT